MKTNELYKILLEEIFSFGMQFDIFPITVPEVHMIPRPMGYSTFEDNGKGIVSSGEMGTIPLVPYGIWFSIPEFIDQSYEDAFVRLCLRTDLYAKLVKPSKDFLASCGYLPVKGFISGEILTQENDLLTQTEVTIKGNIAIYGDA